MNVMKSFKLGGLVVVLSVIMFFVVTSESSFIRNYWTPKVVPTPVVINPEEGILKEDRALAYEFQKDSSLVNQEKYLAGVNERLASTTLSDRTKRILLLRKAVILSMRRGSGLANEDRNQASDILKSFIFPPTGVTIAPYSRDYAIAALVHLHFQCCEARPFALEFPDLYKSYANLPSPKIAKLMVLNDLTKMVSPEDSDDITIVSNGMLIKAELLTFFKGALKPEDVTTLTNDLGKEVASFSTLAPKTFTDFSTTNLESTLYYAYAYDAYYSTLSKGSLSPETNAAIDKNYMDVFDKLDTAEKDSVDKVSLNNMRLYNGWRYARSLDTRYPDATTNPKMLKVIDQILSDIESNQTAKYIADSQFKVNVAYTKYTMSGYFVGLARKHKKIADYMASIGITQDMIK